MFTRANLTGEILRNKKVKHEYPLYDSEIKAFQIKPLPKILEWAQANVSLTSPGYVYPGPFVARKWQQEIIDASLYWHTVIEVGSTQVGKSVCAEIPVFYYMSVQGLNGMVAYANKETAEDKFKFIYCDMIKENEIMRGNWSGKDDDLTIKNLHLKNCLWRVASAQNKNDLATFSAAICVGDEVAKWEKMKYDPVLMLKGRQGAYSISGQARTILLSSPYDEGDYLYKEVYKKGNLIVQPHYQCPHCKQYQIWTDYQIKIRKNGPIDEKDHDPGKIRAYGQEAVFYECMYCRNEITEEQRYIADQGVIWAAPNIETEAFKQNPEKILSDGTVVGRLDGGKRNGYETITYQFPRLVDVSYSFANCLALFFETKNDNERKKVYENETMARWWKRSTQRVNLSYLETRRADGYSQRAQMPIPDDIAVLTYGGDTQDNGFYYAIVGWGFGLKWQVLKYDFIHCPMVESGDPREIFIKFRQALNDTPLKWSDGTIANFKLGLQDRGGHRAGDVDFICKHTPNLHPYIGLPKLREDKPVVYRSDKGEFYLGQSEALSDEVGVIISGENFFLPNDADREFMEQIGRQFRIKKVDLDGQVRSKWIHGHSGADHYRDCLNLNWAAGKLLKLDQVLFNLDHYNTLLGRRGQVQAPQQNRPTEQQNSNPQNRNRISNHYHQRAIGGR